MQSEELIADQLVVYQTEPSWQILGRHPNSGHLREMFQPPELL